MVTLDDDKLIDDQPIRGTKSLVEIYQTCNLAVLEPAVYGEAKANEKCIDAMEEELIMIEKNHTWQLAESP